MLKYGKDIVFKPELLDPDNIDRKSILLIPNNSRVLEIGCATGFMGEFLIKNKKCNVVGVELRKEEAKEARKKLHKVIKGDIEDNNIIKKIQKLDKFDIILASALIEHLKDPWITLEKWKMFLRKNGSVIITTSNIAHWSIRWKIIRGRFNYEQYGILDNTHLRFFTSDSFQKLIKDCGYIIDKFLIDPVGGGSPRISRLFSRFFPNIFAYQMLIKARAK